MTVSIGQYLPGRSMLHRADPRTKFILTLAYMIIVIYINSFWGYLAAAAFVITALLSAKINVRYVIRSLKPVIMVLIFTMILNMLFYNGETVWLVLWKITIYKESVLFSLKMLIRIILLCIGASILTYTTTSVTLTNGLESMMSPLKVLHFPAHDIAMMMSIALRFIPTLADETERIIKAQTARGSDFDSKNIIERIKSYIPIFVPLFVSSYRRAEELAIAMTARGYRGGEGATKFKVLRYTYIDLILAIVMAVFILFVVILEKLV